MLTLQPVIAFAFVTTLVTGLAVCTGEAGATFTQDPKDVYVRPFSGDLCFIRANADDTADLLVWSHVIRASRMMVRERGGCAKDRPVVALKWVTP
jgi:hypothetical protein